MTKASERLGARLLPSAAARVPPAITSALRVESWSTSLIRLAPSEYYHTECYQCSNTPKPLLKLICAEEARVLAVSVCE